MLTLVENWQVDENMTTSDHNTITFNIKLKRSKGIDIIRTTRTFNTKKANWDQFRLKLTQLLDVNKINKTEIEDTRNKIELENKIETYTKIIIETCNEHIPKVKSKVILTCPWWSEELAAMKKEVATRKRRIRCAAPVRRDKVVEEYLKAKEKYELEEKKAQTASWKQFCEKQDKESLWDGIYRVIRRTSNRQEDVPLIVDGKELTKEESAQVLAKTFYPEDKTEEDNAEQKQTRAEAEYVNEQVHDAKHDPPFTQEELLIAANSFNPKKAPGADGLTADICRQVITQHPEIYLSLVNKCLELGLFPKVWKEATVVVLRKPGKDSYTSPKSYRPIGLLPVMGKILEKMAIGRVKWHVLPKISPRQYGFMPQKSTEDSLYVLVNHIRQKLQEKKIIIMISLDIEGAFDSAWWPAIRTRLAEEECPLNIRKLFDSYLEDRRVRLRYAGEEVGRETSKGCVQGSIGGPVLWNLLLDPLLHGLEHRGDYCQAFADDVVMVFDGDTALEIQQRANAALAYVQKWGVKNKLKFAPQKTKAMLLTRRLKFDAPLLTMGGTDIGLSQEIKILGLTIDNKLTFNSHATNVCKKALNIYKQLSRAAKVNWGLHPEVVRTIYTAVVEPVILYAASVWAPAARKLGIQKQLNVVQRGFAQKLCKSYRTASLNSALVLAGILPLDLRIQEAAALYEAKRGVSQSVLGDREVERMTAFTEIPHPAENIKHEFISLVDEEQVEENSTQAVRIFTDGSKIDGKVGAALSFWNNVAETKNQKLKLPSYCTVYQAELLAICKATREIVKRPEHSYGIYSDSRSSLDTVLNHRCLHPLAVETRGNLKKCKDQNKQVTLFWIKAHAGLEGNERADYLAKEAALNIKSKPEYDLCPVSFIKRQIRMDTLGEWNRRYKSGETASVTKLFLPDAVEAYKIVRKIQPAGILTQIMTGHGGFSEYLHRFKCKDSPSCICEPNKIENVEHVLTECPAYGSERYDTEQKLGQNITAENFSELISCKTTRQVFVDYCVKIGETVIKRNG